MSSALKIKPTRHCGLHLLPHTDSPNLSILPRFKTSYYFGSGIATVTWSNGSTSVVDADELSFTIVPDLQTIGTATVSVAYGKTSLGVYCQPVTTSYQIEVTNPIVSIAAKSIVDRTYYYYNETDTISLPSALFEVTATYSDGTKGSLEPSNVSFSLTNNKIIGEYTNAISCEVEATTAKGTFAFGATDFTNGWWTTFTESDTQIPSGESKTFKMMCYSDNLGNWHSPCYILRSSTQSEYAVCRSDNFGWGVGYDGIVTLESDWNWDLYMTNISTSDYTVIVTNNGDGTADLKISVVDASGTSHYQNYIGIAVTADDLYFGLVTEESYIVMHE